MGSLRVLMLAGAAAIMTLPAARAGDLPPIIDREPPPIVEEFASGWYLRGDVGVGIGAFRSFDFAQTNPAFVWPASWNIDNHGYNDAFIFGAGFGYQFNNWLRFDVTGEYRTKTRFGAVGGYTEFCSGGGRCFDVYDGHHSASVFLANAYFDLGSWWRITPFVGAGVGGAYHRIGNFWDLGLNSDGGTGRGFASDYSHWNFAWALHAGLAYNVSRSFKVELSYRYLNMGDVRTGIVDCIGCGVANGPLAYYTLRTLDSHDLRLGVRWLLDQPVPIYAPPLVTKG